MELLLVFLPVWQRQRPSVICMRQDASYVQKYRHFSFCSKCSLQIKASLVFLAYIAYLHSTNCSFLFPSLYRVTRVVCHTVAMLQKSFCWHKIGKFRLPPLQQGSYRNKQKKAFSHDAPFTHLMCSFKLQSAFPLFSVCSKYFPIPQFISAIVIALALLIQITASLDDFGLS